MKLTKKDCFFIGLSIVSLLAHACLLPAGDAGYRAYPLGL